MISAARARALQLVFGDAVPASHDAVRRLVQDAPVAASTRPRLLEDGFALAGQRLHDVIGSLPRTAAPPPDAPRPARPGAAVRLVEVALAAKTDDGLFQAVSADRARRLFEQAARMKDVPWRFLEEGCIHRAHVVAKRFEDEGVYTEKVFAVPLHGEDLVIESDKAKLGYSVVWFHAANVAHVADDHGRTRRMVIDPAVADAPLPVEEWAARMHGAKGGGLEVFFLPRFASQLYHRDDMPLAWSDDELEHAFAWAEDAPLLQADYEKSGFYDEIKRLAGR